MILQSFLYGYIFLLSAGLSTNSKKKKLLDMFGVGTVNNVILLIVTMCPCLKVGTLKLLQHEVCLFVVVISY